MMTLVLCTDLSWSPATPVILEIPRDGLATGHRNDVECSDQMYYGLTFLTEIILPF